MSKKEETLSSPELKRSKFQELKSEFGKVTWPTKEKVAKQSVVVFIVSILLGLLIWGIDILLGYGLNFIIG